MKLFPEDPVFDIGKVGFDSKDANDRPYDVLGRKPLGQKLTELVDRIDQPLVIALDACFYSLSKDKLGQRSRILASRRAME